MDTVLFHAVKHELSVSIALNRKVRRAMCSKVRKTRCRKVHNIRCCKMHEGSEDKVLQSAGR